MCQACQGSDIQRDLRQRVFHRRLGNRAQPGNAGVVDQYLDCGIARENGFQASEIVLLFQIGYKCFSLDAVSLL